MSGEPAALDRDLAIDDDDRRGEKRHRVLRGGKIIFGNSVIDCVVLDVSTNGARVRTNAVVQVPSEVVLRFRGGAAYKARRLWTMGLQMGLIYDGAEPLTSNAYLVALSAYEALPAAGLDESLRILRIAEYFDDQRLSEAAEAAGAAFVRFRTALRAWVDTRP